jgi:hypothetical protein
VQGLLSQRLRCKRCIVKAHEDLPLHRIEVCHAVFYLLHLLTLDRNGRANSLTRSHFKILAFGFNLAMVGRNVCWELVVHRISWYLIRRASITSLPIPATAPNTYFIGACSCFVHAGFQQPSRGQRLFSPSTCLKHFMNFCYKARSHLTTFIIQSFTERISSSWVNIR